MTRPDFVPIFPGKWGKVALCRPEVQNQWLRMKMLMCESGRYGYLCSQDGSPLRSELAARGCGLDLSTYELGLAELSEAGIIHTDKHECIFDPEMVRFASEWADPVRLAEQSRIANCERQQRYRNNHRNVTQPVTVTPESVFVLTPNSLRSKDLENTSEVVIPDWMPLEAWEEYTKKVRPKLRAPNTPLALKRLISKLDDFRLKGYDPQIILINAITYGWKGFWEPQENGNGGNGAAIPRGQREADATRAEAIRRMGEKAKC